MHQKVGLAARCQCACVLFIIVFDYFAIKKLTFYETERCVPALENLTHFGRVFRENAVIARCCGPGQNIRTRSFVKTQENGLLLVLLVSRYCFLFLVYVVHARQHARIFLYLDLLSAS